MAKPKPFKKIKPASLFANKVGKRKATKKTVSNKYPLSGKDLPLVQGSSSEYIKTITALKRRDKSDEALSLLQKIASMVKPIMKQHGLRVTTLCEFFPKSPNLLGLNVNRGLKICIRLRPFHNDKQFYPLSELLGTMLHELTHNIHGPHDGKFYGYLEERKRELENLMLKGFTGDGFFSNGNKLGFSPFQGAGELSGPNGLMDPVQLAEARRQAAELEKRNQPKASTRKRGQRLGTLSDAKLEPGLSMRELALRAAEQRMRDSKWCGKTVENLSQESLEELGLDDDVIEVDAGEFVKAVGSDGSVNSSSYTGSNSKSSNNSSKSSSSSKRRLVENTPVIDLTSD